MGDAGVLCTVMMETCDTLYTIARIPNAVHRLQRTFAEITKTASSLDVSGCDLGVADERSDL